MGRGAKSKHLEHGIAAIGRQDRGLSGRRHAPGSLS
jgi:hypothetical protein